MKKVEIINLKNKGLSNREVARQTGINRETVSKYWEEYKYNCFELLQDGANTKQIQEKITNKPQYNTRGRKPLKYTKELELRLKEILKSEQKKNIILGARS